MNTEKKGLNGFTLAELIVSMAVLSVVLLMCVNMFVSSWRRLHATNAIRDAQFGASISVEKITNDISETSRGYVYNHTSPSYTEKGLYFPSPRDLNGNYHVTVNRKPDWQTWIIYYLARNTDDPSVPAGETVYYLARKQEAIAGTDLASNQPSIPAGISNASVIARNVYYFECRENPGDVYGLDVLVGTKQFSKDKPTYFFLEKQIMLHEFPNL